MLNRSQSQCQHLQLVRGLAPALLKARYKLIIAMQCLSSMLGMRWLSLVVCALAYF